MAIVFIAHVAGGVGGLLFAQFASRYFDRMEPPNATSLLGAAVVLITAAIAASLLPAARAARIDVLQALRSE
jgi:putative ABC transport system permease protein